jgi:ATP-binding cassette subfamily G (WHITE) protein 2 (SNQ2)
LEPLLIRWRSWKKSKAHGTPICGLSYLDLRVSFAREKCYVSYLVRFAARVSLAFFLVVLGRPEAGSSTFLKTIANRRSEYHSVEGDVFYDSISPSELHNHYRGDVQYCPEDDIHFPTLTVDQTLKFASTTRTPRETLTKTRSQFARKETDVLTTIFGLRHAKNTPVGNAAVRGVSGGEKKRVSIAESLATRARISCWDK